MTAIKCFCLWVLGVVLVGPVLGQDTIHFRPEGPGDPVDAGETYTWNTTLANWYDAATGGTAQSWAGPLHPPVRVEW